MSIEKLVVGAPGVGSTSEQIAETVNGLVDSVIGSRIVFLGDSITQGANDNAAQSFGQSYPLMATLALKGRAQVVRNAGVSGNVSAEILARFDADVTPYAPNVVALLAGMNDVDNGVTFDTYKTNIVAIVAKIRSIGAVPALATIPPRNEAQYHAEIIKWNIWLRMYSAAVGAILIDLHPVLVDQANGNYLSGYTADGVHPLPIAQKIMGDLAAEKILQYIPAAGVTLVADQSDTLQLMGDNPLFLGDSNTDGIPNNWYSYGETVNVTHALETVAGVMGDMAVVTQAGATSIRVTHRDINGGWSPGDELLFGGVVTSDGGVEMQVKLNFAGAGSAFPLRCQAVVDRGVFSNRITIPVGTTALSAQVIATAGTGQIKFGQISVYNLTTLGLLTI